MTTTKAAAVMVDESEIGCWVDVVNRANNHRITVVRMAGGHVGVRFSPLPDRDGYPYAPMVERTECVTAYPWCAALPSVGDAMAMRR